MTSTRASFVPRLRSLAAGGAVVALACTALVPSSLVPGALAPAQADHGGHEPGPVHAGKTYGWWHGGIVWREEFEQPYTGQMGPQWKPSGNGQVWHQNGMLTLNATQSGSLSATLDRPGAEVGRWETRLRSRQYGRGGAKFRVNAELVPAGDAEQNCGARNIALTSYRPNNGATNLYARNLPNTVFKARHGMAPLGLGRDQWHTYAVEVTKERVSWFVDAHVVHTEKRPEIWSGVPLTVRFTMEAREGKTMNISRMQMDWVRHWSLAAPNDLPVDAPPTKPGIYGAAC